MLAAMLALGVIDAVQHEVGQRTLRRLSGEACSRRALVQHFSYDHMKTSPKVTVDTMKAALTGKWNPPPVIKGQTAPAGAQ